MPVSAPVKLLLKLMPALVCAGLLLTVRASAQDPFEIHVYQYETLHPGQFTLEQHLNYVGRGTKTYLGTVAPTNDQFHMTYEITGGITDAISVGFMLLSGARPGGSGLEYAGWRVLPHFYVPRSWHWPLDVGLVAEFSFQQATFEENARRLEIRPIFERKLGHLELTANPVFERALHGPGTRDGWSFEPALRAGYGMQKRFTPSLEYYGGLGPVRAFLPFNNQIHQIYSGGDVNVRENVLWSVGVGVGITPAGDRLVFKSRIEIEFGGKGRP
jgi:hypothetical protein